VFVKLAALVVVAAVAAAGWMSGLGQDRSSGPLASATAVQPRAGEQTIQITEADLNQRLSQRLVGQPIGSTPLGTATLESITTQLTGGHVIANGDAKVATTTVPVSMTASGSVSGGRAIVVVDDLKAAGMSLPASTRQSVQQTLQAQLDDAIGRQQMKVSAISIDGGKLTLTGTR
jgi:LmeA-like phospholipid-binding